MKICLIAQPSISLVSGGPLVQVRQTARYLQAMGIEIEYFDQWKEYPPGSFDLAHIFGANFMNYDTALRLKQFAIPFVVSPIFFTLRSASVIRKTRMVERRLGRFVGGVWTDYGFSARVCSLADRVLPNTHAEGALVEHGFEVPAGRIRVVPNGVEDRFLDADPELFIRTYGVRDFILNVGHIGSPRKNVLRLVEALRGIDRPAVIIGRVQQNEYSERCLAEAARNPMITIIPGLANDSAMLASAYAAASLFVLPSHFETPGIAALEAALAGASVTITRHGGTEDYFGDRADYIDPASAASIRAGIEKGLRRPRDGSLREHIRSRFLWQNVAAMTADVYREIVDSR
jgi:glycosyltransferase involved in cell wall biosynthesis